MGLREELIAYAEQRERELLEEMAQMLVKIKRDCSPGFAERVEEYMRRNDLLLPHDRSAQ